jgi:hypothetical protein
VSSPEVLDRLNDVIAAVERLANAMAEEPEAPAAVPLPPPAAPVAQVADERYLRLRAKLAGRNDA